jgi:hypothetical protein
VALTGSLPSDATFRRFPAPAQEPGVVEPGEVERSAPPPIRPGAGAEVLFAPAPGLRAWGRCSRIVPQTTCGKEMGHVAPAALPA